MNQSSAPNLYGFGKVNTVHILHSGEIITSVEAYMKIEDRFAWVDRKFIIERILHLRKMTDDDKKSVIVIYEEGHVIKEFVNVDHSFIPLAFF
jgi:hypothetical protein